MIFLIANIHLTYHHDSSNSQCNGLEIKEMQSHAEHSYPRQSCALHFELLLTVPTTYALHLYSAKWRLFPVKRSVVSVFHQLSVTRSTRSIQRMHPCSHKPTPPRPPVQERGAPTTGLKGISRASPTNCRAEKNPQKGSSKNSHEGINKFTLFEP